MTKHILVTGVAGFLGANLLKRLMAAGHRVVGIDNLSMGRMENVAEHLENPDFTFIKGDVTEAGVFAEIHDKLDCIVHLAAFKIPRYGKALDTLRINYQGSDNTLQLAREHQCKCVLASTSDVYGRNPHLPFSEQHSDCVIGSSKSPRWGYAVSKLFDEHLAFAYQDAYGFPVTLLRFFGSYGPLMHLSWWGGPPPVFIEAVLKDQEIPIHGDGLQTRSFTYVSDTVEGIYAGLMRDEANGEILNIGSRDEITIVDLAKTIKRIVGTPGEVKLKFIPYEQLNPGKRYEDVMRRIPDIEFSRRILGVSADIGLDEGLSRTIEWQRAEMEELEITSA